MKIAVIVSDATGAAHVQGMDIERYVGVFEMPPEMERYVKANTKGYVSISFALVDDEEPTTDAGGEG
jgi:hypothetical protein